MRILAAVVGLVLAAALAPFVIAGMWSANKIEHTDAYVATVAPLASDPTLRKEFGDAIGTFAAEELARRSPITLPSAAGTLIRSASSAVVDQPGFATFWTSANRDLHRQFLAIMDEDPSTTGYVYVDATPLLNDMLSGLADRGLPTQVLAGIPLEVPVARESRIADQRHYYHLLTKASRVGPWLWLAIVVASVAVAPGWRGRLRAVAFAALGVAVGAVALMLAPGPATSYAAKRAGVGDTHLARLILRVVLDTLGDYARPFAAIALPVALVALLVSVVPRRREAAYEPPA